MTPNPEIGGALISASWNFLRFWELCQLIVSPLSDIFDSREVRA